MKTRYSELGRSVLCAAAVFLCGCAQRPLVLYTLPNLAGPGGEQRVWPHFVDRPLVIAFWSVEEIESIDALEPLSTLHHRHGPVRLTTVCVSKDRMRIDRWIRKQNVDFEVLYDPGGSFARRLGVRSTPTFVFFDKNGHEIDRSYEVLTIHNWFDRARWIKRADPDLYPDESELPPPVEKAAPESRGVSAAGAS